MKLRYYDINTDEVLFANVHQGEIRFNPFAWIGLKKPVFGFRWEDGNGFSILGRASFRRKSTFKLFEISIDSYLSSAWLKLVIWRRVFYFSLFYSH